MTTFVAIGLAVLTSAFIAYPFFRQSPRSGDSVIDNLEMGTTEVEEEIEKLVLELRRGKERCCPQCGASYREGDRFCSRCGASLSKEEAS